MDCFVTEELHEKLAVIQTFGIAPDSFPKMKDGAQRPDGVRWESIVSDEMKSQRKAHLSEDYCG